MAPAGDRHAALRASCPNLVAALHAAAPFANEDARRTAGKTLQTELLKALIYIQERKELVEDEVGTAAADMSTYSSGATSAAATAARLRLSQAKAEKAALAMINNAINKDLRLAFAVGYVFLYVDMPRVRDLVREDDTWLDQVYATGIREWVIKITANVME